MRKFTEVYNNLVKRTHLQRLPLDGKIELTHRCNLKCIHCYVNLDSSNNCVQKELSTSMWKKLIYQLYQSSCLRLLFTGGEILIRKDFPEIYRYAKELGFIITLYTNATLINKEIISLLKKYPPFLVEISIYGSNQKVYESITGIPGSYKKCKNGVELLIKNKINVKLKTMLIKNNYYDLENLISYAKSMEVPFSFDPILTARVDGSNTPFSQRIDIEKVIKEDKTHIDRWRELKLLLDTKAKCAGGISSFLINPYGELTMCVMCRDVKVSLLNKSFITAWDELGINRNLVFSYPSKCLNCESSMLCLCPGLLKVENNNNSKYICELSKKRYKKLKREVVSGNE